MECFWVKYWWGEVEAGEGQIEEKEVVLCGSVFAQFLSPDYSLLHCMCSSVDPNTASPHPETLGTADVSWHLRIRSRCFQVL